MTDGVRGGASHTVERGRVVDVGRIRVQVDGRTVWRQHWAAYVGGQRLGYFRSVAEAEERIAFFQEHGL